MELDSIKDIKVLLIEDDEDDYLITRKIFKSIPSSPFILEWVSTFEEAQAKIDEDTYDLYLVDYRLGEHTGLELLEYAHPEKRRQPFILLTGVGDSELEWKSLRLAASDYLVKGSFDATLLSRTLYYALQRKQMEGQRIEHLLELSRSKDEFISIASHQLRTPATGVKQYLGMVLEGFAGEIPARQRDLLQKAYDSNERQLRIVADLLKVAQVDSGKMKLRLTDTKVSHLLEDVINEQVATLEARRQNISFSPCEDDCSVKLDADVFRMVFENIVDNASKYSPEGTTIEVNAELKRDKNEVCVCIADEGVGVAEDDVHRMFEKFSRIDNPLSTKVGGTGLGLYWARQIIDMHDGRIEYERNGSKGSKFIICLPVEEQKL
jgi:two-component system sensor histidine kinase/response regulator